ncbi:MAG: YhjD/YihY/BrkB family envelope integrity protein, partial [Antricoccus sp.]
ERKGTIFAAGLTYRSFLAIFPLLLLGVAILGFALRGNDPLLNSLTKSVSSAVPGGAGDLITKVLSAARDQASGIGIISLVLVAYTGLSWMTIFRTATQEMWAEPKEKPSFMKAEARDLATLFGLGLTIIVSVALSSVASSVTTQLVKLIGLDQLPGAFILAKVIAISAALIADTILFYFIISVVPGQSIGFKAALPGALLGAFGIEVLKIVATFYLPKVAASPAAGIFGSILVLLVWINLMCELVLFVIAWTATSPKVTQLTAGRRAGPDAEAARLAEVAERAATIEAAQVHTRNRYSPRFVLGVLVTIGAVAGSLIPGFLRRWWNDQI